MADDRVVIIAIDGSKQAEGAFNWYCDNISKKGDMVIPLHCTEMNISIGMPGRFSDTDGICKAMKEEEGKFEKLTASFAERMRAKGIAGRCVRINGKPGEELVKFIKQEKAAMVVMGTRGMGTVRRTILGSVSDYVIHHATCPVIVVRGDQ